MKQLYLLILLFVLVLPSGCFAVTFEEIDSVKEHAYRVGTSDEVELRYQVRDKINLDTVKKENDILDSRALTYADLSIKKISKEISNNLDLKSKDMMEDLSLLWRGAAVQSDTIKFALYKLANPDADKPNEHSVKKVLSTIASMSTLVGAGIGNPILSSGSFLGSNLLGIASQDDKSMNYKFSRVTDADMIILVRKIDELQQVIVNSYYDYMSARKLFDLYIQQTKSSYNNFSYAEKGASREVILVADAYYRESADRQMHARNDFYAKRAALEQLVGKEIFQQFEKNLDVRESARKK